MMRSQTPAMMSAQTNALLRRDVRLDSRLVRDLRFDRFLRRDFGMTPFWGTWGGGFMGSGASVIPVGVAPFALCFAGERCYVSNWGGDPPRAGDPTAKSSGTPTRVDETSSVRLDTTISSTAATG